jgi:hypothetical protein
MMRLLVVLLAAVAVLAAPVVSIAGTIGRERLNEARPISEAEMAELLMTMLRGRLGVSAARVEAGDVVFRTFGHDVRMGLAPLSAQLNALPDAKSRQDAFDKLTQRVIDAVAGRAVPKSDAERARFIAALIPVMKNQSYVEQFAAMARKKGDRTARLLHVPLEGDIIVAAGLDLPKITRFVSVGEGGAYGMSDKDVLRAALDNWVRRVKRFELRELGKLRAFHFDTGDYNASILLLENPWKDIPELPPKVVIAVPSRDILAFGDAGDAEAVAALRALTKAPDGGFPVSKRLYTLGPQGFAVMP